MQKKSQEYLAAFKELGPIIQTHLPMIIRAPKKLSIRGIITDTIGTKHGFCPDMTLTDILMQELPYYQEYGHNAFDSGYLGLTRKSN